MSATLWDIISTYVKDKHPHVPIDPDNSIAGMYRFRVWVLKNTVEITDAGASPGLKAPEDFPNEVIRAADPNLFKKISKICKYRGKGGVCVYRETGKLRANWTMVAAPDLVSMHNISVDELVDQISKDIKPKRKKKMKQLGLALILLLTASCGKEETPVAPVVERAKDPVCGMWVEKKPAPGHPILDVVVFDNACYFFCAEECSKEFVANPTKYTTVCKCPHSRPSDLFPEDRNCKCEHCQGKMEPCDCRK